MDEVSRLEFPKITICPNGMHSIEKLTREYKDLNRMAYGELYKEQFYLQLSIVKFHLTI